MEKTEHYDLHILFINCGINQRSRVIPSVCFRRVFGVERGHYREFAVCVMSSAAVCSGSGLLQLPNETAPSLQLSGHSLLRRRPGLSGSP